eukprot:scaffold61382_cov67-Phaeocystis_antarctica.AAC.5
MSLGPSTLILYQPRALRAAAPHASNQTVFYTSKLEDDIPPPAQLALVTRLRREHDTQRLLRGDLLEEGAHDARRHAKLVGSRLEAAHGDFRKAAKVHPILVVGQRQHHLVAAHMPPHAHAQAQRDREHAQATNCGCAAAARPLQREEEVEP